MKRSRRSENEAAERRGHAGKELWGKRPGWYKSLTHRLERRYARIEITKELEA